MILSSIKKRSLNTIVVRKRALNSFKFKNHSINREIERFILLKVESSNKILSKRTKITIKELKREDINTLEIMKDN